MLLPYAAGGQIKEELSWNLHFWFWQTFVPNLFRCFNHSCKLSPCSGADDGRGEANLAPCSALELFPGAPKPKSCVLKAILLHPQMMGKEKPIWRLAFFSRLEERKGIKLFVDAVSALNVTDEKFEVHSLTPSRLHTCENKKPQNHFAASPWILWAWKPRQIRSRPLQRKMP